MTCEICNIIKKETKSRIIYRDNDIIAFMPENGYSKYHIIVAPINHYPIFDVIPDDISSKLFITANNILKTVARTFNINSDNMLINNGIPSGQKYPHITMDLIPRIPDEKITLNWTPKPADKELLAKLAENVKGLCQNIDLSQGTSASNTNSSYQEPSAEKYEQNNDEKDYLMDSLNRRA